MVSMAHGSIGALEALHGAVAAEPPVADVAS